MRGYMISMLVFAAASALGRAVLLTTKTRYQIAILIVLAALFELFGRRRWLGQRPNLAGFAANGLAIFLAALCMKIALEGPLNKPAWVRHVLRSISHYTAQ